MRDFGPRTPKSPPYSERYDQYWVSEGGLPHSFANSGTPFAANFSFRHACRASGSSQVERRHGTDFALAPCMNGADKDLGARNQNRFSLERVLGRKQNFYGGSPTSAVA